MVDIPSLAETIEIIRKENCNMDGLRIYNPITEEIIKEIMEGSTHIMKKTEVKKIAVLCALLRYDRYIFAELIENEPRYWRIPCQVLLVEDANRLIAEYFPGEQTYLIGETKASISSIFKELGKLGYIAGLQAVGHASRGRPRKLFPTEEKCYRPDFVYRFTKKGLEKFIYPMALVVLSKQKKR